MSREEGADHAGTVSREEEHRQTARKSGRTTRMGPGGEVYSLLKEHSLSTVCVPGPVLSTTHQGKQDVVPAQAQPTLLYLAVYALLSTKIAWLPVRTRDFHPHLPRPLDSRSKDEAWVPLCFTGVSDDLILTKSLTSICLSHCLYSTAKLSHCNNADQSHLNSVGTFCACLLSPQHSSLATYCVLHWIFPVCCTCGCTTG